jgi:hypothetical protein|nr:MAG TPA: Protein of unknown function (DUF1360) [Caudoviricetes sp.]
MIVLAGFALAYLLTATSGPFDVFSKLRSVLLKKTRVLECMVCTGVWTTVLMWALSITEFSYLLKPISAIGLVIILVEVIK